ncbi:hypothetical protein T12_9883 [Trichinella patagoniensis]|uniref:Uncharacterized protein n=1 Tax=Trichinella patagoniensis TaxID=990121 RepID=A0A0V0ZIE0_9BILA|nr:hypothetical protein T12_9883 [Trichinella patagoniensis]
MFVFRFCVVWRTVTVGCFLERWKRIIGQRNLQNNCTVATVSWYFCLFVFYFLSVQANDEQNRRTGWSGDCVNYFVRKLESLAAWPTGGDPTEKVMMIQSNVSGPPAFTVSVRLGLPNEQIAGVRFRHTFVIPSTTTTCESSRLFLQPQIATQLNYERQASAHQQPTGVDRDHRHSNHRHRRRSRSSSRHESTTISDSERWSKSNRRQSFSPCRFSGLSSAATQQRQRSSGSRSDNAELAINTFSEPEPATPTVDPLPTVRVVGDLIDRLDQFSPTKETLIDDPAVPAPTAAFEPTRVDDPATPSSTRLSRRPSPGIALVAEPKRFSSAAIFAMYAGGSTKPADRHLHSEFPLPVYSRTPPTTTAAADSETSESDFGRRRPVDRWSPDHLVAYDEGSVCHSDVVEPSLERSIRHDRSDSNETLVDELASDHGDSTPVTARRLANVQRTQPSTATPVTNSLDQVHEAVICCRRPIKHLNSLFFHPSHPVRSTIQSDL